MAVAAGEKHTVVVCEDGSVFSFGNNQYYGQLGTGDYFNALVPTRVGGLPPSSDPVRQVAAGRYHTGIVTEAGDLLMCGWGEHGQLGLGNKDNRATPTLVARAVFDGEAVLMVACGSEHTVAVTEGGGVYTFGCMYDGKLGYGDWAAPWEENQLVPRRVPPAAFNGERVVMVAAGGMHTVGLSEAGHVFTWGGNMFGQLGHNDREHQWAPRQVDPEWFGGEKVVFVAAGGYHTVVVTAGGRLYTWGHGRKGQLGHGDTENRLVPTLVEGLGAPEGGQVVMAACGDVHTLVVTQDGGLWACGFGGWGQLGLNDYENRRVFERLEGTTGAAFGGARVVAAAAGDKHSAAVTEDGALWTWGWDYYGQLGHDDDLGKLGHNGEYFKVVPTRVPAASLEGTRIGRCRPLPTDHAVALAMGTHSRLGAASPVRVLGGEVSLLTMITRFSGAWVGGVAGRSEGLVRLLGGVTANPAHRYQMETVG